MLMMLIKIKNFTRTRATTTTTTTTTITTAAAATITTTTLTTTCKSSYCCFCNSLLDGDKRAWKNDVTVVYTSGTDKSLARPGRKQATATEDFDFHIFYL
jgi:hypothetical protein